MIDTNNIINNVPELKDAAQAVCDELGIELVLADGPIFNHEGETITIYTRKCVVPEETELCVDAVRKVIHMIKESEDWITTLFLYTIEHSYMGKIPGYHVFVVRYFSR